MIVRIFLSNLRRWLSPALRWLGANTPKYDLEASYSITSVLLGLWIFFGHAISSVSPSVRGLRLLGFSVQWLPWSVDWTWAALLVVPSLCQLFYRRAGYVRERVKFCMMQAMVFSFISLLLFLDFPASTGVVMYSMPAVAHMVAMRRIIRLSYE